MNGQALHGVATSESDDGRAIPIKHWGTASALAKLLVAGSPEDGVAR